MKHRKPDYVHVYTRRGKQYIYFRRKAQNVSLPGPLWSEQFWRAYHHALQNESALLPIGSARTIPGSFNDLIARYYSSHYFTALATSTRSTYRGQLEWFRERHGDKRVAAINASHIDTLLGELAERSTAQADKFRDRLKTLMKLAVRWDMRRDNPMLYIEPIRHVEKGYRAWTEEDIAKFQAYWTEGTQERIAMEVLLNTGLRRSDAVRLSRAHVDKSNWVTLRTKKSQGRSELHFPLSSDLLRHLAHVPKTSFTFIAKNSGGARSEKAFTNWLREAAHKAGLPSNSSPHGLRKAACSRLAEAGCTTHQIMAITGHRSISEIERYTRASNQKKLARNAMEKMDNANTSATKNG